MPVYEYKCEKCKKSKDLLRDMSEVDKLVECECGGKMNKVVSVMSFNVKIR